MKTYVNNIAIVKIRACTSVCVRVCVSPPITLPRLHFGTPADEPGKAGCHACACWSYFASQDAQGRLIGMLHRQPENAIPCGCLGRDVAF